MAHRTVAQARDDLHKPATAPVVWSTLRRSLHYGATENAVRKRLEVIKFCGEHVAVHRLIVGPLSRVESRIRAYEKRHPDLTPWHPKRVECFNWRKVRGGTTLSHHAHAVALDIDPDTNQYHAEFTNKATCDIPKRVIQAFLDEGWTWGGNWNKPLDPMHMQWR